MEVECEICHKTIKTDNEEKPTYAGITGWDGEGGQANVEVCKDCFKNKPEEILKKLEKMEYE